MMYLYRVVELMSIFGGTADNSCTRKPHNFTIRTRDMGHLIRLRRTCTAPQILQIIVRIQQRVFNDTMTISQKYPRYTWVFHVSNLKIRRLSFCDFGGSPNLDFERTCSKPPVFGRAESATKRVVLREGQRFRLEYPPAGQEMLPQLILWVSYATSVWSSSRLHDSSSTKICFVRRHGPFFQLDKTLWARCSPLRGFEKQPVPPPNVCRLTHRFRMPWSWWSIIILERYLSERRAYEEYLQRYSMRWRWKHVFLTVVPDCMSAFMILSQST